MLKIKDLETRIKKLMKNEDRRDVEMRFVIAASELGDLAKYISHDQVLNPNARPHGTKEDEVLAYGQALVQVVALAYLRGISAGQAFKKGLQNWEEADWRKVVAQGEGVEGLIACPGVVRGQAYVAMSSKDFDSIPESSILVTPYATPSVAIYLPKVLGCVTDHGGLTCHMASVAREMNVPCLVGTGNATNLIQTGQEIVLEAYTFWEAHKEKGRVTFS